MHLSTSLTGPYGLPTETPRVTQRAFHWCRVLDLRSSWHDHLAEFNTVLRRYVREHKRLSDPTLEGRSIRRHRIARRRIDQAMAQLEWPNAALTWRDHKALTSTVIREIHDLQELKHEALCRARRLRTLRQRHLPRARSHVRLAEEQCRKTDVFQRYLTMLPFYEIPGDMDDPLLPHQLE